MKVFLILNLCGREASGHGHGRQRSSYPEIGGQWVNWGSCEIIDWTHWDRHQESGTLNIQHFCHKGKYISCRLQWADPLATVQVEWQGKHLLVICLSVLYLWFLFLASSALGCLAETSREVMSWSGHFMCGCLSPGSWKEALRSCLGPLESSWMLSGLSSCCSGQWCAENLKDMHSFEPTGDPKCGLVTPNSHCPMSLCSS